MRKMILPEFAARVTMLAWVIGMGVLTSAPSPADAQSWGGLYNMDSMLDEGHPFATRQAAARAMKAICSVLIPKPNRSVADSFSGNRQTSDTTSTKATR